MTGDLARRSVMRTLRQPANIIPTIVFPMVLVAVNAEGLDAATKIPGFPADSYLDFGIAVPFVQGGLFAMMNAGTDLANDVEGGFLKRLALTPVSRLALLGGQLAGVVLLSFLAAVFYLVIGAIAGVDLQTGFGGALVLIALAIGLGMAFASFGAFIGLRTGSGQAVQGFFPLFFVLLFLSSANMPRPLIEQDWFRTIATWNPVSYLVEGVRSLIITGWDGAALWKAAVIIVVATAVGTYGATRALRTAMVRT
ncbi:ABC transporter permease [Conexibacter sp. SYSU D00693]|uniref:ABC transporter permease n=1 Tax=Conexibacter sp. SYSU D00693 TaxID=2812560 RepID=UPI00196AEBB4|nr:ABC transporter permease [Conexibacter sp. SYSU D00693]